MSSPRALYARLLVGAAALCTVGGLVATHSHAVSLTDAAWQDQEFAGATVGAAEWATAGYASATHASWALRHDLNSAGSGPAPRVDNPATMKFTNSGGNDDKRSSTAFSGFTTDAGIVQERNTNWNVWSGTYSDNGISRYRMCLAAPAWSNPMTTTSTCTSPASRAQANDFVDQLSLSVTSSPSKRARINVGNVSTTATCGQPRSTPTAAVAYDVNSSIFEVAKETQTNGTNYSGATALPYDFTDAPDNRYDGFAGWYRYNVNGGSDSSFVLAIQARKNTFVSTSPQYALAEVDMTIQIYSAGGSSGGNGSYIDTLNLVVSRSECGVAGADGAQPSQAGAYRGDPRQAGWPSGRPLGSTTVVAGSTGPITGPGPQQPSAFAARGAAPQTSGTGAPTPSSTAGTVTPTDSSTASTTSTSAPPPLIGASPTPTPTPTTYGPTVVAPSPTPSSTVSAAPPPAPGALDADADVIACGEVEGADGAVDALAEGTSCPVDAAAGVRALGAWAADGTRSAGWTGFTSADPSADGWTHAVVADRTGTTLYLR